MWERWIGIKFSANGIINNLDKLFIHNILMRLNTFSSDKIHKHYLKFKFILQVTKSSPHLTVKPNRSSHFYLDHLFGNIFNLNQPRNEFVLSETKSKIHTNYKVCVKEQVKGNHIMQTHSLKRKEEERDQTK